MLLCCLTLKFLFIFFCIVYIKRLGVLCTSIQRLCKCGKSHIQPYKYLPVHVWGGLGYDILTSYTLPIGS